MKFVFPTILIIVSMIMLFGFISPTYKDVKVLRDNISVYNTALADSTNLQKTRDGLVETYKSISDEDKERLNKFLPNTVNNIKFILEVERLASLHNMSIKDIKFDPKKAEDAKENGGLMISVEGEEILPYGVFPIEFTASGNYESFISFIKDLEKNLRLVDISSVSFSSSDNSQMKDNYDFVLKVETYWLK